MNALAPKSSVTEQAESSSQRPRPEIPDHELVRCIGSGSYGDVWLARSVMGSYRAIKVVYRKTFDHDRPFEREFTGIKRFEPISRLHSSQVAILHVGRNDEKGYFFYIMELADDTLTGQQINPESYSAKNLRGVLFNRGRIPFDEALRLGIDLTTALAHLHKHGLIHRDIKPSNIIFVNGIPKLADIGLVAHMDATRSFVGTEGFLPPEGPGTRSADLYSLGKVLYEISTGKDRKEFPELPVNLRELTDKDGVLELNEILVKACDQNPARRYQSAEEMHADLALLQSGKSIQRIRTIEKRLARATRLGIFALIAIILAGGAFLTARKRERAAQETAEFRRQQLVRLNVANGVGLLDEGDLLGSLPWFAEALNLEKGDRVRERMHRVRLTSILQQAPRLEQLWFEKPPADLTQFKAALARGMTPSWDYSPRVWDTPVRELAAQSFRNRSGIMYTVFSQDRTLLLTADWDGRARIVEAQSGAVIPLPAGKPVIHGSFSPDGREIVTAREDGTAEVWNASTGERKLVLQHTAAIRTAFFSPDGGRIVTGSGDNTAQVWDAANGAVLAILRHGAEIEYASFSPDGKHVVTAGADGKARIWDPATGHEMARPLLHGKEVYEATFSPDGTKIVTASGDGTARVWDATSGRPLTPPLRHSAMVWRANFSSDGLRILTASFDSTAAVWDASTGERLTAPLKHGGYVMHAAFSPDQTEVFTTSRDRMSRIWDIGLTNSTWLHLEYTNLSNVAFSPNGARFAAATHDNNVQVFSLNSGRAVTGHFVPRGRLGYMAFSPDGRKLVTCSQDGWAQIWNATTGQSLGEPLKHRLPVQHAAFSEDGELIVTSSGADTIAHSAGEARVWNAESGKPLSEPFVHERPVQMAAFSPDATRLITASTDSNARLWEIHSGKLLTTPLKHLGTVKAASFSPDGTRVLTACWEPGFRECYAQIWDAATGQRLTPPLMHRDGVLDASFSHDGKRVVTASEDDTARVWDAITGEPITPPLKHHAHVRRASFSPDDTQVLTASDDSTARVWDSATGDPLTPPLKHRSFVYQTVFSSTSQRLYTACDDGRVRGWNLKPDKRSVEELVLYAQLLSAHYIDKTGALVPLKPEQLLQAWQKIQSHEPLRPSLETDRANRAMEVSPPGQGTRPTIARF